MYRSIFLCLLFAHIQAADNGKSIVAMTQRLRALEQDVEQKSLCDGGGKFVYTQEYEASGVDDPLPEDWKSRWWDLPLGDIREVMQDHNASHEVPYFWKLGSSELDYRQKVSEQMVRTPFFDQLAHREQEERDTVLRQLLESVYRSDYPVGRLLLAASLYAGASPNVKSNALLATAVIMDDVLLVGLALQKGAPPNCLNLCGDSLLSDCESIEVGELMVEYGANVAEASWHTKDLVYCACSRGKIKVLPFYLDYIPPSKSNKFGKKWMKMASENIYTSIGVEQVEILLEHGCQYDEETKTKICERVAKHLPDLKKRIEEAFANAEIKKI